MRLIFGALPTKITHTTQAVRKDPFFSDSFLRWDSLLSWLEHHGRISFARVSRVFRANESAQNAKTALYQKRILCNRDRAKPYPCCQNIKTTLYQKRGLDLGGTIYGGKSVSLKRFAL